jgi:hypothetical protein
MPKANKKTVLTESKINIPQVDQDLITYHPKSTDGGSSLQLQDWNDGFTAFIELINARKVKASIRTLPEDSN